MTSTSMLKPPSSQAERLDRLSGKMKATGQWSGGQVAGRRWTIGCVSLEITQRCNLDCTLCYLSDTSEAIQDVPLEELYRRIDEIAQEYGPNTDVQISGGDPTLRDRAELSLIVRYVRAQGLRASLFTNGILLDRAWLAELANDGLNDVAFHVDMTQERKGFSNEVGLNRLRQKYIEMARDLPLSVIFNTTVYSGNFQEIPAVVRFFVEHSDVVRFASFQLGADTGRGTIPGRVNAGEGGGENMVLAEGTNEQPSPALISQASVCAAISEGAGVQLNFDALKGGHSQCNKYAMLFAWGDKRFDALSESDFVAQVMRTTAGVVLDRDQGLRGAIAIFKAILRKPNLWPGVARYIGQLIWWSRGEWLTGRFFLSMVLDKRLGSKRMPSKISFFTHNFMDACGLDPERIEACVFMAASVNGLMSMCSYNAERDRHLLKPIVLKSGRVFQPLALAPNDQGEVLIPLKWLKGRARQDALSTRALSRQNAKAVINAHGQDQRMAKH
jgi:7,8-dihydro-6-hydroxymethylpterin dimethyltransferase